MSKTRYTGVTKDDKTGKYTYYFKAGVDLATGKPKNVDVVFKPQKKPLKHVQEP